MQTRKLLLIVGLGALCLSAAPARAELWPRFQIDETAMTYTAATQAAIVTDTADVAVRVVPVPAAVLLGMLGLSVTGVKLRKLT